VDIFISGGTVVTMDAEFRVIEDGGVAIEGDAIAAVGKRADLEPKARGAKKTIDARGTLVLPGMINGHAHAAMSLFRGVAEDHSLDDWLQRYIFPAESRNVTEDFVFWGTRLGVLEMLRGGVTTYAKMYYFETWSRASPRKPGCAACSARRSWISRRPITRRRPRRSSTRNISSSAGRAIR